MRNFIHSLSKAWGHRGQGLPFCVAGVGDLLALFRCISCRYCFGTNIDKPDLLGAPGRVFTTMEVSGAQALRGLRCMHLIIRSEQVCPPACSLQSTRVPPSHMTAVGWAPQQRNPQPPQFAALAVPALLS